MRQGRDREGATRERQKPRSVSQKKKAAVNEIRPKSPLPEKNKKTQPGPLLDIDTRPQREKEPPVQQPLPQPHKIEPERKQSAKKPFVDSYDLPGAYNTTNLTLIARDPFWIYAYWEITPSSIEELKNRIGSSEFERSSYTLRMYDTTYVDFNGSNANRWFDIDVGPYANNWYISLWNDSVTYCGEIGIRTPDGRFLALSRSNFVTTPRAGSSGRSDLFWMEVKEGFPKPAYVVADTQAESHAFSKSERIKKGPGRKIFLSEEDIRAYYSKLFPLLKRFISVRNWKKLESRLSRSSFKYRLKGSDILFEDFLIGGLSPREFIKKIILGSSEEMLLEGASQSAKGGASEKEQKKRQFFFEIGTELIVYGRTEPDAEVFLGDKKIELRKDGTFTLRFALPEGKIPLDFLARSKDKSEKRSIKTEVERSKTAYGS